jgi:hypothetical protein
MVKDKVRMAIIKNPRLERKKFIILTSTLKIKSSGLFKNNLESIAPS